MPNVLFVVASRRPLGWHDPVRAFGLTYGGEHRWPGLAAHDQLGLGGFDSASAAVYLATRLTVDERPAIAAPIRDRIIAGSAGSPPYLGLSVGLYAQYLARREQPPPGAVGLALPRPGLPPTVGGRRSMAAFLRALRAAAEHRILPPILGDMAYTLSLLGHWQVLASLPALTGSPELAKLTAVARLGSRGDLNGQERYER